MQAPFALSSVLRWIWSTMKAMEFRYDRIGGNCDLARVSVLSEAFLDDVAVVAHLSLASSSLRRTRLNSWMAGTIPTEVDPCMRYCPLTTTIG